VYLYIERGGGRRKEAPRVCCGGRRIELWGTKEKEGVQLLSGEDGSLDMQKR